MDNDRCGTLPFVFDDDFGFNRYVEYALDVPMYFVYRSVLRLLLSTMLAFTEVDSHLLHKRDQGPPVLQTCFVHRSTPCCSLLACYQH